MPVVYQQPAPSVGINQQQAEIDRQNYLAKALMQNASQYDPNQQVAGSVVPISPFNALANALQQGYGAYLANKSSKQSGLLEDKKREALTKALSKKADLDLGQLADAGVDPETLLRLSVANRPNEPATGTPGQWFIPPGSTPFKDEQTGIVGYKTPEGALIPSRAAATEYQAAMIDPNTRAAITAATEAQKIREVEDATGSKMVILYRLVPCL